MTKKSQSKAVSPAVRTSAGLRDVLFDELDALRSGTSNATKANAVAKLASGLVDTVRMDMEVQKHVRAMKNQAETISAKSGNLDPFAEPLMLGVSA